MKLFSHALFISLFLLLASCVSEFKELSISSINDFKVTKLTRTGLEGEIKVSIKNPNSMAFKVFRSKADIYYGGVKLGKAKIARSVRIPGNSSAEHVFKLKGDLKDVSMAELPGLFMGSAKQMEIKGYVKAGKFVYRKKFPINEKQRIKGMDFKGGIPGF